MLTASVLLMSLMAPKTLDVRVDPRIELLTIVFRLAEAGEFAMPSGESPYTKRVDAYFAPYKSHRAVQEAIRIRNKYGIGFNAVPTLAVHLSDVPSLKERVPFDRPPARWDSRWEPKVARGFAADLRAFVKDSHFEAFLKQERDYYDQTTKSFSSLMARYPVTPWLKEFYGTSPSRPPFAIVGLLCGGGNYGMSVEFPNGDIEMSPVIGADTFDSKGVPVFNETNIPLVIHEFSHGYVNPIVRKHLAGLSPTVTPFMPRLKDVFAANAYSGGESILYETFVRAVESYLTAKHMTPELAQRWMINQRSTGFLWTSDLVETLGQYEADRKTYPTFEKFMPVLAKKFQDIAKDPEAIYRRCPQVVDFVAERGPIEGDGQKLTVKVTFDQEMLTNGRGFSMEPPGWEVVKKTEYSADRRSFTLELKVKAGTEYEASVNRFGRGVVSKAGYPLLPYSAKIKP